MFAFLTWAWPAISPKRSLTPACKFLSTRLQNLIFISVCCLGKVWLLLFSDDVSLSIYKLFVVSHSCILQPFLQSFMKHNIYTTVYCLLCACIQMLFYQPIAYKQSHYTCIVFTRTFSHTLFWLELFQCPFIWNVFFFFYISHLKGTKYFFYYLYTTVPNLHWPRSAKQITNNKLQTQMQILKNITIQKTQQFRKHWQTGKGGYSLRQRHWFGNRLLTADWTRHLSIKMYRRNQK